MDQRIFHSGFIVQPICTVVDLETGDNDEVILGQVRVKPGSLATYTESEWPQLWASVQASFEIERQKRITEAAAEERRTKLAARKGSTASRAKSVKKVVKKAAATPKLAAVPDLGSITPKPRAKKAATRK